MASKAKTPATTTNKRAAAAPKTSSPKKIKVDKSVPAEQPAEVAQAPVVDEAVATATTAVHKKIHRSKPSMATYVHRVLKSLHANVSISSKALGTLNAMVQTVAQELSRRTHGVLQSKTVAVRDVHAACRTLFPTALAEKSVEAAYDAVSQFSCALEAAKDKEKPEAETDKVPKVSRQARAKLLVSVSLMEHLLRNGACRVGSTAPVFLAAVLEHLVTCVVNAAVATTRDAGVTRVNRRYLNLAVSNHADLSELFNVRVHVVVPDGGVIPGVAPQLTAKPKRSRARGALQPDGVKRGHRFRPGTVALRNIQYQQRKCNLVLQHAPFDRTVRALDTTTKRFSPDAMQALQQFIESSIVSWLQDANDLALHARRKTLHVADVDLALKRVRFQQLINGVNFGIPGMRRLSQRAGIKYVGTAALDRAQQYAGGLLEACLKDAAVLREHDRMQTLTIPMVQHALQLRGVTLAQ